MSRHEQITPSAQLRRELEAVDAALSGEPVDAADAPLGELTRTLQSLRPRPSEDFLRVLDARAARGFRREPAPDAAAPYGADPDAAVPDAAGPAARERDRLRPRRQRSRALLLLPAAGLGVALAAVLAVSLLGGSGGPQAVHAPSAGPASPAPSAARPLNGELKSFETKSSNMGRAGPETAGAGASGAAAAAPATRQVERTSTLDVGVAPSSIQSAAQRVFTLASAFNGYVRQSSVSSGSVGQGGASFDVRLPASNLTAAIAALSHLGHVRAETDTTNDVTDQLGSLQRAIGGLQAERASLLRQLAAASEAQLEASLRARLHAVEARISQLQGTLGALRSRVAYTSLALSLSPEAAAGAASGDLTPGGAAHDAAQILDAALAVLVIAAAAALPLGTLIVVAWVVIALTRRRLREQALDAS
jgi:hypothetical protein